MLSFTTEGKKITGQILSKMPQNILERDKYDVICFGIRYGDPECEKRLAVPYFTALCFPSLDKKNNHR
jgi:phosphoribosylamine-glycine ligase